MLTKRLYLLFGLLGLVILTAAVKPWLCRTLLPFVSPNTRTIAQRLEQFGEAARLRMKPGFAKAGLAYPPRSVVLVGIKAERLLEIYAPDQGGKHHFVCSYPILEASGLPGPKLREGDGQVPEGVYAIESLNPNSIFHVSLRIGYPNTFDKAQAAKDRRANLGGDIMIHGGAASIGCLAMGDEVAENLFVLAADTGIENVAVILAPVDFRKGKVVPKQVRLPDWSEPLYAEIKARLADLPEVPESPIVNRQSQIP